MTYLVLILIQHWLSDHDTLDFKGLLSLFFFVRFFSILPCLLRFGVTCICFLAFNITLTQELFLKEIKHRGSVGYV